MVSVYDPVSGFPVHNVKGHVGKVYSRFRVNGQHNIVVGQSLPNIGSSHNDLSDLFRQAYSPKYDQTGWFGWGGLV